MSYKRVCDILNVSPSETIHVGDDWEFDFISPRKIGINAFYLDRKRLNKDKDKDGFIINSLDSIFLVFYVESKSTP
jgi:FMN phosphatase YigB (HAD superfamily)